MPEETESEVVVEETAPRTQNSRAQRVEDFLLDPEKVLFESIEELSEGIDFIRERLANVDLAALEQLQGADAITPQIGVDYFTDEDLDAIQQFIEQNLPVAGVHFPTVEQVNTYIEEKVAEIPTQKGDKGDKGAPGKDGRDGSRDTGKDIVEKVRKLSKNQGWKIDDIRGLRGVLSSHAEQLSEVEAIKEIVENMRVIIPKLDNNGLQDINGLIEAGTNIVLTGSGTADDPYVISTNGITNVDWGDIGGTLSDQTDLQNALNAKFDEPTGTTSQYIRGDGSLATFPSIPAGTVTSVGLSAPTGFSVSGSPITASGTLGLTYASGYEGFTTALKDLINSALQPGDDVSELTNDAGYTTNTGTVTSVAMTVPTGLQVSGSPITSSGTLAVSLASGYVIPTTTELAAKLENITGLVSAGTDISISGTGTSGDPYVISATGGSGVPTLDQVLQSGDTAEDKQIVLESSTTSDTSTLDEFGLTINDGAGSQSYVGSDKFALRQSSNEASIVSIAIDANRTHTLQNKSGTLAHTDDITLGALGITATASELNVLDGITATTAELNILDGVTATASEINILDGLTASTTELNYVDGVTSAIQTQLNAKAADSDVVKLTGNQTVADVKTFSSFPVTPSSAPTTDYQVANKKYVDDSKKVRTSVTTSASSLTPDWDTAEYFEYTALAANFTLNAPTNMSAGDTLTLVVTPTGSTRTFTDSSGAVWANAVPASFEVGSLYEFIFHKTTNEITASWTEYTV